MASQKGRDILIKLGDGATPTEAFTTVAGMRSRSLSMNEEEVDVTNSDSEDANSNLQKELLAGAGVNSMAVSGSGVFKDDAAQTTLYTLKADQSAFSNFQVIVPGLGTFEGPFMLTQLEYAGEYNGEATFSMSLTQAGAIAFTAA